MLLIRDFVDEHERALDHCDRSLRAADAGDFDAAYAQLALMTELLLAHWQGEEDGLFAVMSREAEYAEYIAPLVAEHRELEAFLTRADLRVSRRPSPGCAAKGRRWSSTSARRRTACSRPRW